MGATHGKTTQNVLTPLPVGIEGTSGSFQSFLPKAETIERWRRKAAGLDVPEDPHINPSSR